MIKFLITVGTRRFFNQQSLKEGEELKKPEVENFALPVSHIREIRTEGINTVIYLTPDHFITVGALTAPAYNIVSEQDFKTITDQLK